MTRDRILEIRAMIAELDKEIPRPWHLWIGRSDQAQIIPEQKVKRPDGSILIVPQREQKIQARYDLYSGPYIEEREDQRKVIQKGCKQVCHWHPEGPQIYDQSFAYKLSMPFFHKSVDLVEELLNEIDKLREGK